MQGVSNFSGIDEPLIVVEVQETLHLWGVYPLQKTIVSNDNWLDTYAAAENQNWVYSHCIC